MSDAAVAIETTPPVAKVANVLLKGTLVLMLLLAVIYPESGNMQDKAAGLRAILYPTLAFTVPVLWYVYWRERVAFPWLADLMITVTCFTDILGNRMDLYDTIWWFDDWMHFANTGLLGAAFLLLTLPRDASLGRMVERGLAFGSTAAIVWEIGEYFAFISKSTERRFAYADTLSDLGLGVLGVLVATYLVYRHSRRGRLAAVEPMPLTPAR